MNRKLAATALAAAVLGGGVGAALAVPTIATADETTSSTTADEQSAKPDPSRWVTDALAGLVDDGTLTQAQADEVAQALADARPEMGPHGDGRGPGLDVAATAIGIDADALRTELEAGKTIAEVAEANGVDVQTVTDAIVADMQSHLDAAVADGHLTQAQADEMKANAVERATDLVNGEAPQGRPFGPNPAGAGGEDQSDDESDATS